MLRTFPNPKPLGRLAEVLAVPLALALLLGAVAASTTMSWTSTCDTGEYCIHEHVDTGGEVAATTVSVQQYTGNYPGSSTPINNTASSATNLKSTRDVRMFQDYDYGGIFICIESWSIDNNFGFFYNDTFSSHLVMSSDNYC
jgi:Peptidase inhibitor family I36